MPELFPLGFSRLIVSVPLADTLSEMAAISTIRCTIARAFHYPVIPGDMSFDSDAAYDPRCQSADLVVRRFAKAYRVQPPKQEFRELGVYSVKRDFESEIGERVQVEGDGVYAEVIPVPRQLVNEFGILWCRGFLCADRVYDLIRPWIECPYYFVQKI